MRVSFPASIRAGSSGRDGRNLGAAAGRVARHVLVALQGGLGTGRTATRGVLASPHQCPRHRGVSGNATIAVLAEKEPRHGRREDARPSRQRPARSGCFFFSCHIKPRTFLLLFNFLLLHPRQVHSEARNLFPIEFTLVVLFGKGRLPRPWSPGAAERSRRGAARLPFCASPAPVKSTLEIKVTKMLLCCRKSCCFQAAGDKAASQGAGSPARRAEQPRGVLQPPGIPPRESSGVGTRPRSLPGDSKGRPSPASRAAPAGGRRPRGREKTQKIWGG